MPSTTIEYVILVPLLFTQVLVFPLVASTMTSNWQNSQRNIELQDAANHLASTIQQLYITVNNADILACNVTQNSPIPDTIASYPYNTHAELSLSDVYAKILTITLTMDEVGNAASASVVLGENVELDSNNFTFRSTSVNAEVKVEKKDDEDNTIIFSFGGSD